MGFMDNMRDALAAGVRNPGNTGATMREFNERRRRRKSAEEADRAWERTKLVMGQYARNAYERAMAQAQQGPWEVQFADDDVRIIVRSGFSREYQRVTTESLVFLRRDNPDNVHLHVVFDENGTEIFHDWRNDRKKR